MNEALWISKDGRFSFRWDLVADTAFWPNTESSVSQRDHGKERYPDRPTFCANGRSVYYEDALDAFNSFKKYNNIVGEEKGKV